jgi:tRNA-binding protein
MAEIIQFDDFVKLDLRIGTITSSEPHPNADKLIVMQVDLGMEQRQLVAGLRGYYDPAALVGKQVVVVANLAPRMMRGVESRGMLLAAVSDDHSQVVIVTTEKPCPAGLKVT